MPSITITKLGFTQKEYDRRVAYNTQLFRYQSARNEFTPSLYYLWDQEPKALSTLQYCGMDHDIYAAAVTGTLAISDKRDHDAVEMKSGKATKVELKTGYLTTKNVWKSSGGKIYVGDRTSLTGYLGAKFGGNPPEDDMKVYFVCCDTTDKWNTEVIDVWQMDGQTAIDLLKEVNSKTITLQKFINFGKKKKVEVETIGWGLYKKTLLKRLPEKKSVTIF